MPFTAGLVTAGLGGYALAAPGYFATNVYDYAPTLDWLNIGPVVVATTSGTLLGLGVLLIATSWAAFLTRRAGTRYGAYRTHQELTQPPRPAVRDASVTTLLPPAS